MANEKRLIDADVTLDVFTKWLTSTYDGRMPGDVIAEIPTVDAVEVVHGLWVSLEPEIGLFACSECEHKILRAECNYCPNCGARMDAKDYVEVVLENYA